VLVAPLYSAGEEPIPGISSAALAEAVRQQAPHLDVQAADDLDQLVEQLAASSRRGDLVVAMGAGDVNSLWDRLDRRGGVQSAPVA
jgi:UDP-N-acetylmuramate--alanine ligase